MRILLKITEHPDLAAIEHGFQSITYRLMVQLQMKLKDGWSDYMRAIVDTGSPYSIIPSSWLPNLDARRLFKAQAVGLVPNMPLDGIMVETECVATDGESTSDPFKIAGLFLPLDAESLLKIKRYPRKPELEITIHLSESVSAEFLKRTKWVSKDHMHKKNAKNESD